MISPKDVTLGNVPKLLSNSNTNVNSMINRRVSLFYRYPLEASHHMVCPCTSYGVCVVCPGTSELVGQHKLHQLIKDSYHLDPGYSQLPQLNSELLC